MENSDTYLLMKGITKSFGGIKALKSVDLRVERGEIHAIVGENGAGKSTLMKILGGVFGADSGSIELAGRLVAFSGPLTALKQGVAVIYQDLNVMPHLNVMENVWLGRYPRRSGILTDWREMRKKTDDLLARLHANFKATDPVGPMSTADRQLVVTARGLSYAPKVLVFDEPTSSLTPKEAETLFTIMKLLAQQGVSIVFISHHLSEVSELADTITVLRDGQSVGVYTRGEVSTHELAEIMVGRMLDEDLYPKRPHHVSDVLLEVTDLSYKNRVRNVSFTLRRGEVLGVAGLVGSGRSELAHCIYGSLRPSSGSVMKDGELLNLRSPRAGIEAGLALVPEDRHEQGLVLDKSLGFNTVLPILKKITRFGRIQKTQQRTLTQTYIRSLSIRTTGPNQEVQALSGGNQQKVLFGKTLVTKPKLLILDEPTRGVDVGARAEIHKLVSTLAEEGIGIMLISSDLPEIVGMSDRVLVMHEGRATALLEKQDVTAATIMVAATGGEAHVE